MRNYLLLDVYYKNRSSVYIYLGTYVVFFPRQSDTALCPPHILIYLRRGNIA